MYQKCKWLLIPERSLLCQSLGALAIITILCIVSIADDEVTATREVSLEANKSESNLNTTVVTSSINQSPDDAQLHSHSIGCSQPHCQRNNGAKTEGHRQRRDATSGRCETGWTFKGDLCYKLTAELLSWSDAQSKCRSMNSLLVEVENAGQQEDLNKFLSSQVPLPSSAWIGLGNQPTGNWMWGSGRPLNYSKWFASEPDNVGGVEHCVNAWPQNSSSWKDYTCNTTCQGVCQKGSCESGWTFIGESCYKLTAKKLTWSDAQENCRSMNSMLVEVENSKEQEDLNSFLNSQVLRAWIGLSDLLIDRVWIWSSGRPMNYSKWFDSEPNNLRGNEHCVNVWPRESSSWKDEACNETFQGVCQKGYCGSGWTSARKSCYRLTDKLTQNATQEKCRSLDGSLAEIKNSNEQDELHDFLRSQGNNATRTWIGLRDPQKNRVWKWDSGSDLTYIMWSASEPNNYGGDEYCVSVWQQYSFDWNDDNCSASYPGVCKKNKDRSSTLEPSSSASPSFSNLVQSTTPGSEATVTAADHSSTLVQSASISPPFTDPVQPTTLGSKATVTVANTRGRCETGWTLKEDLCYKLTAERLSWSDAQNKCRSMNSLLVEVENSGQQEDLNEFLNLQVQPPSSAWIGLSNQLTGNWMWDSGRPMDYSKWLDSEPNNVGGVEHCVNVWPQESSSWKDYTCNTTCQGVCQKGSCESGWTFIGESCYKLTDKELSWSYAQENCRSMNSLLVEVENSQEQEALNGFLNSQDSLHYPAWIGLSDLLIDRVWIWSSGRPLNYSKWFGSEPNNLQGNQHCVNVWPRESSSWKDYACNETFRGVCQKGYCGSGWTSTRKSCYQLIDATTRNAAQQKCRSRDGSLAEIKNSNEQDELHDFLRSQGDKVGRTWIGLGDPQKNRVWKWDSGSDLTFRKWIATEPNNQEFNEYCVNVWRDRNFYWNDDVCSYNYPGACKKNKDRRSTSTLSASISPSLANAVQPTTPGSEATVTAADTQGCAVSSELCHTLSQRDLCANDLFKNYMDSQCRRACGRCS